MGRTAALPLLVAAGIAIGVTGPSAMDDGTWRYTGIEREHADTALRMSHVMFDHPIQRGLTRARVVEYVRPVADRWSWEPRQCSYEVLVRTYGPFWLPGDAVLVRCGSAILERYAEPR